MSKNAKNVDVISKYGSHDEGRLVCHIIDDGGFIASVEPITANAAADGFRKLADWLTQHGLPKNKRVVLRLSPKRGSKS